jgi:ATP-dependent 26S proteasome regulatory subunit
MTGFFEDSSMEEIGFKYKLPKDENIMRVNLGANKEYGLVDELLRRNVKHTNFTSSQRNVYGVNQLRKFVEFVKDSNQYEGLLSDINPDQYRTADIFAEAVQRSLINYRENNPAAGFTSDLSIQNALQENAVFQYLERDMDKTVANIAGINAKLPKYKMINGLHSNEDSILRENVEDIVDNILMPEFKVNGTLCQQLIMQCIMDSTKNNPEYSILFTRWQELRR